MGISMIGIDHSQATVDIREQFSFTKKNAGLAMEEIYIKSGVTGCILLSTCNRMELWVSTDGEFCSDLFELLCELKEIEGVGLRSYFTGRKEEEAVEHLFRLAGGLESQIFGEDQILSQVKDALSLAREHFTTDNVLEVLFRMAVTAGKKIKSQVVFSRANPSVIHHAIRFLEQGGYSIKGKTCMVIGNGEMGKMAAQTLRKAGADVTVTVRQYHSGVVNIPEGCKRINYGDRMEYLPFCDFVVSATASPNCTLSKEAFADLELRKPLLLIDLAVPRDIDPALGEQKNIILYDMDSFRITEFPEELEESIHQAENIVRTQMDEFKIWYNGRDLIPRIQEIKREAVNDFHLRIQKVMRSIPVTEEEKKKMMEGIDTAAGNVINKIIFGLRDSLKREIFAECIAGLEELYEE